MENKHAESRSEPWYRRVNKAVLAAGALAAALAAIAGAWQLLDPREPPDEQDVADIRGLTYSGTQTLDSFVADHEPVVTATPAADASARTPLVVTVDVTPPPDVIAPDDDPEPAEPPEPTDDTGQDGSAPAEESSAPATVGPETVGPETVVPTEPSPEGPGAPDLLDESPALSGYALDPEMYEFVLPDYGREDHLAVPATQADPEVPGAQDGEPLTVDEVRDLMVQAVESAVVVPVGDELTLEGHVFTAELRIAGRRGETAHLIWRLSGPDVPPAWRRAPVGYAITSDSDDDQTAVDVWVPALKDGGEHRVDVFLVSGDYATRHDRVSADVPPVPAAP
ncbi:hypothetical protein [Cellulomonas hominis]|uniref:hypothetical protein n=1 Tax=Cellulomonas hominis TaxID=156981 RepID=UPI001BA0DA2D|nr:hypothetical protein [Cellulomonas hominis]VTR77343.1 hypothetical protein CHMI_02110 [Cellulomonas hominis]